MFVDVKRVRPHLHQISLDGMEDAVCYKPQFVGIIELERMNLPDVFLILLLSLRRGVAKSDHYCFPKQIEVLVLSVVVFRDRFGSYYVSRSVFERSLYFFQQL